MTARHGRCGLALAIVCVLILACATACNFGSGDAVDPTTDGPVVFPGNDISQRAVIEAEPGQVVVFGAATVKNEGSAPVELIEADLVGDVSAAAAEVIDTRVIDLGRRPAELVGAAVWPFEDYADRSVPLEGFELAGGSEAELLVLVEVNDEGSWVWPRTRVRYLHDGETYQAETRFGFHICAEAPAECAKDRGL